jgi:hypothetical protein
MDLVNLTTINALRKRGLLQAYRSSEFSAYPQPFKDAESYWATLYNIYYVIGYNPKMMPPKDAPKIGMIFSTPSERQNRHGSRRIRVVCGDDAVLGQGKSPKIPPSFG